MVDKVYAMSSFLQFRKVMNPEIKFAEHLDYPLSKKLPDANVQIDTPQSLYDYMEDFVKMQTADGKAALMLSGGIDSAVIANFMPKGSTAYTLKCVVPGRIILDEAPQAAVYCKKRQIEHKIIPIYFEDYEDLVPRLMARKNAPVHSIEIQIYKAALKAKEDGFERLIFGNLADVVFGGFDGLLAKKYTLGEFIERFSYVIPYKVLNKFVLIKEPFERWCSDDGFIDSHGFLNDVFSLESFDSYCNACELAGIESVDAYVSLVHPGIDLARIRAGEPKYIAREAFSMCYPSIAPPIKIPMFRAVDEWFEEWAGPRRKEFIPNCHVRMTGNQKYYVWILEKFLNEFDV